MFGKLKLAVKQLVCRHDWEKKAFFATIDETRNIRYSIRRYVCAKCGRVIHRDSRYDTLS